MELPFLKKKNQGGAGPVIIRTAAPTHENDMPDDLISQVWDELMSAIENKDKNMGIEALRALVLHIQDEDRKQDQEDMK